MTNPKVAVQLSGADRERCGQALREGRIGLEIDEFAYPRVLDGNWQERVDTYVTNRGFVTGGLSIHGPFLDLNPISPELRLVQVVRSLEALGWSSALFDAVSHRNEK
ncbi:MAG TPA: hypothetical protein VFZ25_03465 [Chloroflexota bacterium]|nr:hypothetical protein [Chloroflexota bacterium]